MISPVTFSAVAVLATAIAAGGCKARASRPPPQTDRRIVWHKLGSWSGHGNTQTGSFTSDTGTLRVTWQTTPPEAGAPASTAAFRLNAHSAISGRLLEPVVDQAGPGSGIGYVQQDPHVFYMVVESEGLNWTFTVEEAIEYP